MEILKAYATKNPCYKTATPLHPVGIVVHSTGCDNPYLRRYVDIPEKLGTNIYGNHWNTSDCEVCVHSFIGLDKNNNVTIANILPYNYACWGVGGGYNGSFNYDPHGYIQFEMCEDDLTDKAYFQKVWNKAVEYCAYLCEKFGFNPLGKNVIVSHKEAHDLGYGSNHGDPHEWFSKYGKTMNDFRQAVNKAMFTPNAKVKKKTSYIRQKAYVGAKIEEILVAGSEIKVLSDLKNGWSKVQYYDTIGYLQNTRINKAGLSKYKIATVTKPFSPRMKMDINSDKLQKLKVGDKFTVICLNPDTNWYLINVNGKDCFCKNQTEYFKINK